LGAAYSLPLFGNLAEIPNNIKKILPLGAPPAKRQIAGAAVMHSPFRTQKPENPLIKKLFFLPRRYIDCT
jgi:hypothetical protein